MPGAGKSTLGVLLAKAMNYRFLDSDLSIQEYTGQLLYKTIEEKGIEEFLNIEETVLCSIAAKRSVIATGGSEKKKKRGMEHLKENGKVVYIKLSF